MSAYKALVQVARRNANRALTSHLAGRVVGVRLTPYNRANDFCRGRGIEIGALSSPFAFSDAEMRYADVATADEMRQILAEIPIPNLYQGTLIEPDILLKAPRYELDGVGNDEVDFVYSSHSLEHTPNTIYALSESLRVTRSGGHVYVVIPNREETYDVRRQTTPVAKLIEKYEKGIFAYTLEEALDVVENTVDHPLYSGLGRDFAEHILAHNSGIHHFHTFDPASVLDMLSYCQAQLGCKALYFCAEGKNIHFCLRKH